eukprot:TRINITY_DN612_c0_g1_i8.p1 TRINITY_DN612_c0_g1~~TRINITY_DN612_c0_g1_i8.p1  ORF type:complete len:232 (+),score=41.25 TRINITY_DN612_c0_g1_i8:55-750(+)
MHAPVMMFGNKSSKFGVKEEEVARTAAGGVMGCAPKVPSPKEGHARRDSLGSMSEVTSSYGSALSTFTHDPYSWGEVKRAVSGVSRSSSVSSCDGLSVASSSVSKEGSYPISTHQLLRSHPNQRFGAWIRGNSITNVVPEGPADIAGLAVGMRILAVDNVAADPATVSAVIRKTWKELGCINLLIEARPPGTRSKRSMAKARSRQRSRAAAAAACPAEVDSTQFGETVDEC